MQKTVKISKEKSESLYFYKYLCQKVGTEEVVKVRRLTATIIGLSQMCLVSGSKGEGLHFKTSDYDVMMVDPFFRVYESEKEVDLDSLTFPLIMNTEETQPCYTQLCLYGLPSYLVLPRMLQNMFQKNHVGCMFSSTQYKLHKLLTSNYQLGMKIHGPCISDAYDRLDIADCLRCKQWIVQAQPWVRRSRSTWPPPEIISKIITCGLLFVPIGCKGSVNENLEWRISFSVAEKFLIFSFSHTQFLCYALLKILLKEIVEKHEDLKSLLCSYFLKTLMFWISEETEPNVWRPDNIIPCFMACLQRLMYCVRYSNLSHYFIPENNLFYSRFNVRNKEKLTTVLENLYEQGMNCFALSETLQDYQTQSYNIDETSGKYILLEGSFSHASCYKNMCLLYHFLHHSSSSLSRGLLALHFSKACMYVQDAPFCCYSSENKLHYLQYKYDLSLLLIGVNSNAVSGWLRLASFFYVNKHYVASLTITKHTLQKYTNEKIYVRQTLNPSKYKINHFQKHVLNLMKNEKLYTAHKTLKIYPLSLKWTSSIIPQELQLYVTDNDKIIVLNSLGFTHFLSFLCYYNLQDITSCRYCLQQLHSTISSTNMEIQFSQRSLGIFCGIAHELLGETYSARRMFQAIADDDFANNTRLRLLSDL